MARSSGPSFPSSTGSRRSTPPSGRWQHCESGRSPGRARLLTSPWLTLASPSMRSPSLRARPMELSSNQAAWERLCHALERPEWLEDPRFAKQAGRGKHTDVLEAALVEWFSARKTAEVVEHLSQYRVPAAPINTVEQAANDPHLHQRETFWRSRTPWRDASTCRGKWSSSARRRWW